MPITIKSTEMKYKNPTTGLYQGVDAIAEMTTSEQCALIEAKGTEVIAAIPSDYTALSNKVGSASLNTTAQNLSGAVNELLTKVGSAALNTTAQNLSGAINELLTDETTIQGLVNSINFANASNVTTASSDLDTYTSGGVYYFSGTYSPIHKPDGVADYGFLFVINGGNTARLIQIWASQSNSTGAMYFRSNSNNTLGFSSWKRIAFGDMATKELTPTVVSPLPTGVTAVGKVTAAQSGNVVTVFVGVTRDTNDLTSYTSIASGLPVPKLRPMSGSYAIPHGQILPASDTLSRALNLMVTSTGNLAISRGKAPSGTVMFLGSFTYITE